MAKNEVKRNVVKAVKAGVLFAVPALVSAFVVAFPGWAQLTLGAVLVGIADAVKRKFA